MVAAFAAAIGGMRMHAASAAALSAARPSDPRLLGLVTPDAFDLAQRVNNAAFPALSIGKALP